MWKFNRNSFYFSQVWFRRLHINRYMQSQFIPAVSAIHFCNLSVVVLSVFLHVFIRKRKIWCWWGWLSSRPRTDDLLNSSWQRSSGKCFPTRAAVKFFFISPNNPFNSPLHPPIISCLAHSTPSLILCPLEPLMPQPSGIRHYLGNRMWTSKCYEISEARSYGLCNRSTIR